MDRFWVGIPGELTPEQLTTLRDAGFEVDLPTAGAFGSPPDWETLRTPVLVSANNESEAIAAVAAGLDLEPGDLVQARDLVAHRADG